MGTDHSASDSETMLGTALETTAPTGDRGRGGAEVLAAGMTIGRYHVLHRLGAGGMGVVYAAYDPELDRKVAVKLLLAGGARGHARLVREARAMAKLNHPNVAAVHDVGVSDDRVYVAMEFVDGQTLSRWIERIEPDWRKVLDAYVAAGRGLAAAHDRGLVHRDFKPDNVMVGVDGRVRVLDFGIAQSLDTASSSVTGEIAGVLAELAHPGREGDDEGGALLTRPGALMGTPRYMAPEQWAGIETDGRTDQFAFCVALYHGLFGEHPFGGSTLAELAVRVTEGQMVPPSSGGAVPSWVRKAVVRGLASSPSDRWPTMDALLAALGRDSTNRRLAAVGVGLALVGIGVGVVGARASADAPNVDPCADAGSRVEAVWSDETATALRNTFEATNLVYAGDTATDVTRRLGGQATRLQQGYRDACLDTRTRGVQSDELLDRRVACLDAQLRELRATTHVLQETTAETMGKAVKIATALPDPTTCEDTERLLAAVEPPPAALAERVASVQQDLAESRALSKVGRSEDARAIAERGVTDAGTLAYGALTAEALLARADAMDAAGRYEEARRDYESAFFEARAVGHDTIALDAALDVAFMLEQWLQDVDAGLEWVRHAEAEQRRVGTPTQRGRYHSVHGGLLHAQQKFDEALVEHAKARTIFEVEHGERSEAVAISINNVGTVHAHRAQWSDAIAAFEEVVELRTELLGPRHPMVAAAVSNLGAVQAQAGHLVDAEKNLKTSLALREAIHGPDHPEVASPLQNLTVAYFNQGKHDEALAAAERAVGIYERSHGTDSSLLIVPLSNLAHLETSLGKNDQAIVHLERALAIAEDNDALADSVLPSVLGNLGSAYVMGGRSKEAQGLYERTMEILERLHGPNHGSQVRTLMGLSNVHRMLGDVAQAIIFARRTIACAEANETANITTGDAYWTLAELLWMNEPRGNRAKAREPMLVARELYRTAEPSHTINVGLADDWLRERGLAPAPEPELEPEAADG